MELDNGVIYPINRKERTENLDFERPQEIVPESVEQAEEEDAGCVTCLNNTGQLFYCCESCNRKFHGNCYDGEYCPNCGFNKFYAVNNVQRSSTIRGSSGDKARGFDSSENRMYSRIVDQIKSRQAEEKVEKDEVSDAWGMMDMALGSRKDSEEVEEPPVGQEEEKKLNNEPKFRFGRTAEKANELKRPRSTTHMLTMDALNKHDPKLKKRKIHEKDSLNYIQKLIIYRLIIKPRILSLNISQTAYTRVCKNISRKFYDLILNNKYAMNSLNALVEFSEREGITLKDKRSIDKLFKEFGSSTIVLNFTNGGYLTNELGPNWISNMIENEFKIVP